MNHTTPHISRDNTATSTQQMQRATRSSADRRITHAARVCDDSSLRLRTSVARVARVVTHVVIAPGRPLMSITRRSR